MLVISYTYSGLEVHPTSSSSRRSERKNSAQFTLRSTTISIRSAISSLAKFTNKGEPARWPNGTPSRPQWRWHLDEVFVKVNGKLCYLWRAVDHEGEVLEAVVTAKRDKAAALKLLKR